MSPRAVAVIITGVVVAMAIAFACAIFGTKAAARDDCTQRLAYLEQTEADLLSLCHASELAAYCAQLRLAIHERRAAILEECKNL